MSARARAIAARAREVSSLRRALGETDDATKRRKLLCDLAAVVAEGERAAARVPGGGHAARVRHRARAVGRPLAVQPRIARPSRRTLLRPATIRRGSAATYWARERRAQRDEQVAINLPPHTLALWARTRRLFRGAPHARLEAFEQYQHDHPGEVFEALQADADRKLAAMIAAREREENRS